MKRILGVLVGLIAVAVIGAVAVFAVSNDESNPLSEAASEAKAAGANAVIDATGLKGRVKDALEARVDDIAAATGLSASEVQAAVDGLAIEDWTAVALPKDAVAQGTFDGGALGVDGTVTVYEDSSYVTVQTQGQSVTLEVPESARSSLSYLSLL